MNKLFFIFLFMHVNTLDGTSHEPTHKLLVALSGCNNAKVVLDLSRISDLSKWENENTGRVYAIKEGRIYVDLASIPQTNRAMWLYKNNGAINFDESSVAISCMHTIPNIGLFNLGTVKSSKTLGQIKSILASRGTPLADSCEQYVALSFDSNNNIDITTTPAYDPTKRYYSMALFMAIGRGNGGDATQFIFHKATYQNAPVIVIEITGATKTYYDFAQFPM